MFHAVCRLVALTCLVLSQAGVARAESAALSPSTPAASTTTNEGFSGGWSVHRFQGDFAIGASISTPSMVARTLRITAGTSGRADRQAGAPIFANGRLISAAMHFYP